LWDLVGHKNVSHKNIETEYYAIVTIFFLFCQCEMSYLVLLLLLLLLLLLCRYICLSNKSKFLGLRAFIGKILSLFFNFCATNDVKSCQIWSVGRIMVEQSVGCISVWRCGISNCNKIHNFHITKPNSHLSG